jgi:hypothetical protein
MGPLAAALLLIPATIAWSATSTLYKGKTSQHRKIQFRLSNGSVTGLKLKVDEKCPDGHILTETITIVSAIPVTNAKFGGKFVPTPNPHGEHTNIKGKFVGNKAKGSVAATNYSLREKTLCSGKALFKIKAH